MSNYSELLKDPRWQKKRLSVFERDKWSCRECSNKKDTLHVHHKKYTTSNPWDEPEENLTTLCAECHEFEEGLKEIEFLKRHAREANITCINLWRMVNVISFTGKFYPERLRKIKDVMNEVALDHHGDELWEHTVKILKHGQEVH